MIPIVSFDGRRITRKYERNKAARKSCSVTRQDAHERYSPYVARMPLQESPWQAKKRLCDSAWQDFMSYTVKPYMTRLLFAESPLSRDCEGLRDRRGSASCSLALSINSRGFCREKQSQFSSSVSLYSPFSLCLLDACFVLGFIIAIHWWSRVYTTTFGGPNETHRK